MKPALKRLIKSTAATVASYAGPHKQLSSTSKLWILMYHRILPNTDCRFGLEEPGMIVTPETFAMQMREVKRHFDIIDLSEWIKLKEQNLPLPRKACAITFDDGWADNYEYAYPILKSENIPSTLFVVAEKIGTDFQFWPNIIMALIIGNTEIARVIQEHPLFAKIFQYAPIPAKLIDREYAAVYISHLKQFSDQEIFTALNDIMWRSLLDFELPNALMSWEQLLTMKKSALVNIGSHTCNHKRLTDALSEHEMIHEIIDSKKIIENRLSSTIDLFCFPNGDYSPKALELVQKNYAAAVTTQRGINKANTCINHELTRVGIHDQVSNNRKLFGAKLSGWL